MLQFDKSTNTMTIIAKDTGTFIVQIDNYLLDDGDTVYFTINDKLEGPEPLVQKVITEFEDNCARVQLSQLDTDLPIGEYKYDVQVNTADGRVDTILGPSKFKVKGGVTY